MLRETLEDVKWHHIKSYTKSRSNRKSNYLRFGNQLKLMKINTEKIS